MDQEKGNLTEEDCRGDPVTFPVIMMVTGIVGNALALLLIYKSYHRKDNKRKRSFLIFIGSLALTDMTGQLLTSPIVIAVYQANRQWNRVDPSPSRPLCAFFGLCVTIFGLCPLLLANAMAVERTIAIRAPHWYSNRMTDRSAKAAVLFIWASVTVFAMLPIAGAGKYTLQWPGTWCFISTGDTPVSGNTIFALTFAGLGTCSLIVTFGCNLATIKGLVTRCKTRTSISQTSRQREGITTETTIQLMGIICVLFACWSPMLIMMLKMIFSHTSAEKCKISSTEQDVTLQKECNLFLTATRLAGLNQILDPWVYLLLRKILLQKFCQVANAISNCSNKGQKTAQDKEEIQSKLQTSAA